MFTLRTFLKIVAEHLERKARVTNCRRGVVEMWGYIRQGGSNDILIMVDNNYGKCGIQCFWSFTDTKSQVYSAETIHQFVSRQKIAGSGHSNIRICCSSLFYISNLDI